MKGALLLFIILSVCGIFWGYADKQSRKELRAVVRRNLQPILFSLFVVTVVTLLSLNTTIGVF